MVASAKRGRRQGEEHNSRQVEKVIGDGQIGRQLVARGSMFFYFYFNLLRTQGDEQTSRHFVARRSIFFVFLF